MIYFILDNIFNPSVRNGVYLRYAKFITYLLSKQYEITLITRYVENVKYPDKLRLHFIPFINAPEYDELFAPIPLSCIGLIPHGSVVISLNDNFTIHFDLSIISKHSRVIYGYHTRFDLYSNENLILNMCYNFGVLTSNLLSPSIFLVSGHSSIPILKYYYPKCEKYIVWYDIDPLFLNLPLSTITYDNNKLITLIYTGRISQDKKVDKLFEIFYKCSEYFANIQLAIYGNGPEKNRLISQYGNDKRIILGGLLNQDEMYTTYNSFSNPLFVFPSTYETLGKSPIEASLCGIPVFTAMSDETPYIYQHRHNGFIWKTTDECCEYIREFMSYDGNKQIEIRNNGLGISSLFNIELVYEQIISAVSGVPTVL